MANNNKFISRENAKTLWGYMVDLLTGKYTKPSGGIPKSDLESSVQTSLGKADTALQSFTETDPTVPSWAKATNKPSYTQDEVGDGTTYKRVSSTEKDTWNGKQNALSTTQLAAVNSGIDSAKVGQISTNQSNILYTMDHGAKNLFNMYKWMNECSVVGGNKSVDSNYTLTLGATSSNCYTEYEGNAYPSDVEIYVQPNEQYVMTWGYSRTGGSGRGTVYIVFVGSTGEASVSVSAEIKKIEFTTPAGTYGLRVYIKQTTSGLYEQYAYMMICSKVVWDSLGHDYQPPSLPNYDLTRLEAENRASLAEVVDGGAKNVVDTRTTSSTIPSGITLNSNGTLTVNGTFSSAVEINFNMSVSALNNYILSGCTGGSNSTYMLMIQYRISGGDVQTLKQYSDPVAINLSNITWCCLTFRIEAGKTVNTTIKPMICTLANWNVSQKYVPYKGNFITAPICRRVRFNCTSTDYEHVTGLDITIPADTYVRISASLRFSNGAPRGIKIIDTTISNPTNAIVAINETNNDYGLISTSVVVLNVGTVRTYNVYTKSASVSGNDVIITVEYLGN